MAWFNNWYTKEPRRVITKDTPRPVGLALFFSVLWQQLSELCKLNLLMILFSLPLVSIPTVLVATARVLTLMFMDQPLETFTEFFNTFKKEWKRATIAGLIYFPLLAISIFALYFYSLVIDNFLLYTVAMLGCAVLIIIGFYLFPLLAMVDLKLQHCFKNAALLTVLKAPKNILALVVMVGLTILIILFLPPSIVSVFLLYFALMSAISTFCAYGAICHLIIKEDKNE